MVRLGQKYYRVGGDGGGYRKAKVFTAARYLNFNTDFIEENIVTGQDLNLRPSGFEYGDHCFERVIGQF